MQLTWTSLCYKRSPTLHDQLSVVAHSMMPENRETPQRNVWGNSTMQIVEALQIRVAELEARTSAMNADIQDLRAENTKLCMSLRQIIQATTSQGLECVVHEAQRGPVEEEDGEIPIVEMNSLSLREMGATGRKHQSERHRNAASSTEPEQRDHPSSTGITIRQGQSSRLVRREDDETEENGGWYLEYSAPPATASVTGSFSIEILIDRLVLEEETVGGVKSLAKTQGPGMRIFLDLNIAFICDPIILEGPDKSYLISWDTKEHNLRALMDLTNGTCLPVALHIFTFQARMDSWCYLELHLVSPVKLEPEWSWRNLHKKELHILANELKERWNSEVDASEIVLMLETDRLEQCCLELDSTGLANKTRTFLANTELEDLSEN